MRTKFIRSKCFGTVRTVRYRFMHGSEAETFSVIVENFDSHQFLKMLWFEQFFDGYI